MLAQLSLYRALSFPPSCPYLHKRGPPKNKSEQRRSRGLTNSSSAETAPLPASPLPPARLFAALVGRAAGGEAGDGAGLGDICERDEEKERRRVSVVVLLLPCSFLQTLVISPRFQQPRTRTLALFVAVSPPIFLPTSIASEETKKQAPRTHITNLTNSFLSQYSR